MLALLAEKDLRDQQRYDAQTKAVETAMQAQQTAMAAALAAADRFNAAILAAQQDAVNKANVADDKRFDLLNELRVGVATREQVEALEKVVSALSERVGRSAGSGAGMIQMLTLALAGAAVITAILVPLFVSR